MLFNSYIFIFAFLPVVLVVYWLARGRHMLEPALVRDCLGAMRDAVEIPVIASGGVGNLDHLVEGITLGGADAVLAASIFHFGEYSVPEAKAYMAAHGIEVRL